MKYKILIDKDSIEIDPTPNYNYKWKSQEVECEYCHAKFDHEELGFDTNWGDSIIDICPKCEKSNCCELEYEKIKDALKRETN